VVPSAAAFMNITRGEAVDAVSSKVIDGSPSGMSAASSCPPSASK
jgi:hypothetical protein